MNSVHMFTQYFPWMDGTDFIVHYETKFDDLPGNDEYISTEKTSYAFHTL